MTPEEQAELEDLEVTAPPLAGNPDPQASRTPREDAKSVADYPEDESRLEAFKKKYANS